MAQWLARLPCASGVGGLIPTCVRSSRVLLARGFLCVLRFLPPVQRHALYECAVCGGVSCVPATLCRTGGPEDISGTS